MTKLKVHPDLGGDHQTAVLINQAYAVLGDPKRRSRYDEGLKSPKGNSRGCSSRKPHGDTSKSARYSRPSGVWADDGPRSSTEQNCCLFCGAGFFHAPSTQKHCIQCASPLAPAQPIANARPRELLGRRAAPRIAKTGDLVIYPSWPHGGFSARLRNLSLTGINMLTDYAVHAEQILKFDSVNLRGIAHVVSVRTDGERFSVHASFMTAELVIKANWRDVSNII